MKKIMILASVVVMACAASAASYNWGFSSGEIAGPSDDYNVDGFLDGGYAQLYIGDVLIATAQQGPDFDFGSFDFSASDTSGAVQSLGRGNISSSFVGQAYKLVLRTSDDKYEIVYNGTSSYAVVAGAVGEDAYNYETFVNPTAFTANDWSSTGDVPEPTSGLLMLIGVAGLALRRKQA